MRFLFVVTILFGLLRVESSLASGCADGNSWHTVNASVLPQMRHDYQAYLSANPVGSVIPWAGGHLYRTIDGAFFVDANGNGLRMPNLTQGSPDFAGMALSNPSVAAAWRNHYGFDPCGTPRDPSGANHSGQIRGLGDVSAGAAVQRFNEWLVSTYNSLTPGQSTVWNGHTVIRGGGYGELFVISPSGVVMTFHQSSTGRWGSNPALTDERQFIQTHFGDGSLFHSPASLPGCGGPVVLGAYLDRERRQITYNVRNYSGENLVVLNATSHMVLQSYSTSSYRTSAQPPGWLPVFACSTCLQASVVQVSGGVATITVPATDFLLQNSVQGGLRFSVDAVNGGAPAYVQPTSGAGWVSLADAVCDGNTAGNVVNNATPPPVQARPLTSRAGVDIGSSRGATVSSYWIGTGTSVSTGMSGR